MNIKLTDVNFIYNPGAVTGKKALENINLEISSNEFIAIVGSTGSGKSTLVQLLNGLKLPTSGEITYDGRKIGNDKKELRNIRCRVGLVFQYPEYQLFDESVIKDVSFGPKNKGLSQEEALKKAGEALIDTGFPEEKFNNSPFDLSGGEKRRVAIAGVLAMEPEVIILDEPTAGLDPMGKSEILDLIKSIRDKKGTTIIMVSHNMDEVAEYADRIVVMSGGHILMDDEPHKVFSHYEEMKSTGLSVPQVTELCRNLGIEGPITIEEAADAICSEILH